MTVYGLTPTGFRRKMQSESLASISERQRARISANLATTDSKSLIGNLNQIVAEDFAELWEAVEAGVYAFDSSNAVDYILRALCGLTGVTVRSALPGLAKATVAVSAGVTYLAGTMFAAVDGDPANRWTNLLDFIAPSAGSYPNIGFTSVRLGPTATALAGTLNQIAQPLSGWVSITNPADAEAGTETETVEELRIRRDESVAAQGNGTLPAQVAAVESLAGVLSVKGFENIEDFPQNGLPPHSTEVIVYGPTVLDDDIAKVIYTAKAGGPRAYGSNFGTVTDVKINDGAPQQIYFSRAEEIHPLVTATILSATGYNAQAAKDAIRGAQENAIGIDVLLARLYGALIGVDGVDNVTGVTIGGFVADFDVNNRQVAIIRDVDITLL